MPDAPHAEDIAETAPINEKHAALRRASGEGREPSGDGESFSATERFEYDALNCPASQARWSEFDTFRATLGENLQGFGTLVDQLQCASDSQLMLSRAPHTYM
jgi:hypothetical protein